MSKKQTIDMSSCIICLEDEKSTNILTDEHVIPEFMGGSFFLKNVCKTCNSNMGKSFEGRLSNHIIFTYNREDNNILGKSNFTKNPLSGVYRAEDDSKYILDKNLDIQIPQKFHLTEVEDNKYSLVYATLSEEVLDTKSIFEEIEKFVLPKLRKKDPEIEKIEITLESQDIAEIGLLRPNNVFKLSEEDLKLLALKICYEMYVYILFKSNSKKFLNKCLSDKNIKFNSIRSFLKRCEVDFSNSKDLIHFLKKEDEDKILKSFKKVSGNSEISTDNSYFVFFGPSYCVVRFLFFRFMINADFSLRFISATFNPLDKILYLQNIAQRRYSEDEFFKKVRVDFLNQRQIENNMILHGFL